MRPFYGSSTAPPKFPSMEFMQIDSPTKHTVEQILDTAGMGWGTFTLCLLALVICSLDSSEIRLNGILLDCTLSLEWPGNRVAQRLLFCYVYTMGQMVGLLITLVLADKHGRRAFVLAGLALIAFFGGISAISWSFPVLVFSRVLAGLGAGLCLLPSYHILTEILPSKDRNKILTLVAAGSFTGGPLLVDSAAILTLGLYGWRKLFILMVMGVSITFVVAHYTLVESPRVLLNINRPSDAELILQKLVVMNMGENGKTVFAPNSLIPPSSTEYGTLKDVFGSSLWQPTRSLLCIFTAIGFFLFVTIEDLNDVLGCSFRLSNLASSFSIFSFTCLLTFLLRDSSVKSTTLLFLTSCILQVILFASKSFNILGKLLSNFVLIISAACSFAGFSLTWSYTAELYPSEIRGQAHSLLQFLFILGQTGAFLYYKKDGNDSAVQEIIVLGSIAVATIFAWQLPQSDTRRNRGGGKLSRSTDENEEELHGLLFR